MHIDRLYLDANVLIELGEGKGETAKLLTQLAAEANLGERPFLCTSELTLSEVLVHPKRKQDDVLADQYEGWLRNGSFMEVGPVHRQILYYAAVLRAEHLSIKLPDAIHITTAIAFGCSHMLSADKRLPGTIMLNHKRYGILQSANPLHVIQPLPDVLRLIIEKRSTS